VRAVIKRTKDLLGNAQLISFADYYPFGSEIPGRNGSIAGVDDYRHGYQGIERDPSTGWNSFELRQYDGRLGRWTSTDPYGQHHSPYLAMSNNPVSFVDPDGGITFQIDGLPVSGRVFEHAVNDPNFNVDRITYGGLEAGAPLGYTYEGQIFLGADAEARAHEVKKEAQIKAIIDQGYKYNESTGLYERGSFFIYGTVRAGQKTGTPKGRAELVEKTEAVSLGDFTDYSGSNNDVWALSAEPLRSWEYELERSFLNAVNSEPFYPIPASGRLEYVPIVEDVVLFKLPVMSTFQAARTAFWGGRAIVAGGEGSLHLADDLYRLNPIDGYVDVLVHSTEKELIGTTIGDVTNQLTRQGLAGKPIRLCACNAGARLNGPAQQLARAAGQRVIAPSGYLHTFKSGLYSIQSFGVPLRSWRASTGSWKAFNP